MRAKVAMKRLGMNKTIWGEIVIQATKFSFMFASVALMAEQSEEGW